ncbi:dienelactone hydrolase family protein [Blastococcus xanthinilyticus]|uniref:Dienelactone hydrolase n=1 Tax=Blastococcus xanthinilyticus TaxID=1564164 RepID=A0A5S5CZ48_9ACTN|nr:dienelactone hydrolase family protein [Blastococcus xanthinilyticus]TYP87852.1 dienelactone hydrolase [Blastococcus xanthinilyticus]
MAEVVLFHHAQGLTAGVRAFADDLRAAGHVVHTPDLYEGRTFGTLDEGVAHAGEIGFGTVLARGRAAVEELPGRLVHAGFSLGVMPAQLLAQTRPGAAGAVLMHAAVPLGEFAETWPDGVPVQFHTMAADEEGDVDVARGLAGAIEGAELFVYPGDRHLFTDRSLPDHDPVAAAQVTERVLAFLARLG